MLDLAEGRAEAARIALEPILAQRCTLRGKAKLTTTLGCLAEVMVKLGQLDQAFALIDEARGHADAIESRGLRAATYHRLAVVQEARGNYPAALAATRREFAERDAISGEAAQRRAAELQIQFDVTKKDQELSRLAHENEVQSAEARVRSAQLARSEAEIRAKDAELARTRLTRLALAAGALAAAALLGAVVVVQRARIRAERRILADTRAARDAAEQANELKDRLLGFASHDLKAPLATLSAATHLLEDAATSAEEVRTLAGAMRAEVSRMILLVHDFIDRSALDAGRLELIPSPVDLARIVAHVVADFRPRAIQKNQVLQIDEPPSSLPFVSGEQTRLEQVVANLVANAINYTPKGGSISVTLGHDASGVWCEVRDTGPGISPDDQRRLFQPFSRLSARPTGGESSSGLGLYLAHELVRLHRGTLVVNSQLGAGTTFRLTLAALPVSTVA
jgi:signal transduction histidine kinase